MFESKKRMLERIEWLEAKVESLQRVDSVRRDQIQGLIKTARAINDTLADVVVRGDV